MRAGGGGNAHTKCHVFAKEHRMLLPFRITYMRFKSFAMRSFCAHSILIYDRLNGFDLGAGTVCIANC